MNKTIIAALAAALSTVAFAGTASAAITFASGTPITASDTSYDYFSRASQNSGVVPTPASASQAGGSYSFTSRSALALDGWASVASGSALTPGAALSIVNNTGVTITDLTFSGFVVQFKDNSSNVTEVMTASVSGGGTVLDPTVMNFTLVGNNGDTASTVNNPAITAAYAHALPGVNLANGDTLTIRWTDTNDAGTDALFGLGGLTVTPILATVPEPASLGLLGLSGLGLLRRRTA